MYWDGTIFLLPGLQLTGWDVYTIMAVAVALNKHKWKSKNEMGTTKQEVLTDKQFTRSRIHDIGLYQAEFLKTLYNLAIYHTCQ